MSTRAFRGGAKGGAAKPKAAGGGSAAKPRAPKGGAAKGASKARPAAKPRAAKGGSAAKPRTAKAGSAKNGAAKPRAAKARTAKAGTARGKAAGGRTAGSRAAKNRAAKSRAAETQREVLGLLKKHGARIYADLDRGRFPNFEIPSRSVSNIVYDDELRQYILGKNASLRSARNTSQLRSFTQLMWLAFFANRLTQEKKSSTLRDVYYSSQAFAVDFDDQSESDNIIVDLEAVLARPRESMHIFPEERSSVFGDLNIEYTVPGYEGKRMNLSNHPDGYAIGPSLTSAELIDTSAELVIAIEKGGLFTRFVEEQVDKRFKSIIVDTGGQAPRSTRTLLRRLHDELSLPVIVLTDGDVYGEHIAMVIKSGSANAAHLRELTVPDAKWVGVWASDIEKYDLPTIPMTESDIKRCHDLKKDPRYAHGIWRKELDVFLKIKRKAELEAFSKYGLTNITDKYLPQKIEMARSL